MDPPSGDTSVRTPWRRFADGLRRRDAELRLSFRITVAGLLAFALAHLFDLPQGYWAVLTAIFVVQGSVGGSIKAATDRLVGTLSGAVWGTAVAAAVPHDALLPLGIGLAVALAPLAFLTAVRPTYRIAPITAIILLLGTSGQAEGPLLASIYRIAEIALGSAIGFAVSLLVLPARAHGQVAEQVGRVLDLLAQVVPVLLAGLSRTQDRAALQQLNDRIRAALLKLETMADEAKRERVSRLTDEPDPDPLLRTLRRVRFDFVMVDRVTLETLSEPIVTVLGEPLRAVSDALAQSLREIGAAIAERRAPPSLEGVGLALDAYSAVMARVRQQRMTADLPGDVAARIFGLAFALEQLRRELEDLSNRARELARPPGS